MTSKLAAGAAIIVIGLAACDRGARKDLEQENQVLDSTTANVYLFPDKFPNITHKCAETTGMWTTTGGAVWIVYNDRLCGGEGAVTIIDNIPGSSSAQGG